MKKYAQLFLIPGIIFCGSVQASVPEINMEIYDAQISLSPQDQEILINEGRDLYSRTINILTSEKYWGKHGDFTGIDEETQGSLAYGMALKGNSDLDIGFVYKYNDGESQKSLNAFTLKQEALDAFKSVLGDTYTYTLKYPVINIAGNGVDIDVAFFNELKESTDVCSVTNRCSEMNVGIDDMTSAWNLSERLSLYSRFDTVFSTNSHKRTMINRVGKLLKQWRSIQFANSVIKVPSIALISGLYQYIDYLNNSSLIDYTNSIKLLSHTVDFMLKNDFGNSNCEDTENMVINLPVYQKVQNLLDKMPSKNKEELCNDMVDFSTTLHEASSHSTSVIKSITILRPYLGPIPY